jgi:hypothetical protein
MVNVVSSALALPHRARLATAAMTTDARISTLKAISIMHIGKEADRWEEQFHLGVDFDAQVEYGSEHIDPAAVRQLLSAKGKSVSSRQLAAMTGISRNQIAAFRRGETSMSQDQLRRVLASCKRGH